MKKKSPVMASVHSKNNHAQKKVSVFDDLGVRSSPVIRKKKTSCFMTRGAVYDTGRPLAGISTFGRRPVGGPLVLDKLLY